MFKVLFYVIGEGGLGDDGLLNVIDLLDVEEGENWICVNVLLDMVE